MKKPAGIKKGTLVMLVRKGYSSPVPLGATGEALTDLETFNLPFMGTRIRIDGWLVDFPKHKHPSGKDWICAKGSIIPITDPDTDIGSSTNTDNSVKKSKPKVTEEVK